MNPFQAEPTPIGSPMLGVWIPAVVLLVSFVLTWMLYKHFSRRPPES
jgi:hypothetical protein